jgi:hypothetical protein
MAGGRLAVWVLAVFMAWPAAAAALEPCDLLTRPEVAKLLGMEAKPPRSKAIAGMAGGRSCVWFTAAPMAKVGGTGSVRVAVFDAESMAAGPRYTDPAEYYRRLRQAKEKAGAQPEPAPGLAGQAWWEPGGDTLHWLTPAGYLQVSVSDLTKISAQSRAELDRKISEHKKGLALEAAGMIAPRLP